MEYCMIDNIQKSMRKMKSTEIIIALTASMLDNIQKLIHIEV